MRQIRDLIGYKTPGSYLEVISFAYIKKDSRNKSVAYWNVKCNYNNCHNEFIIRGSHLTDKTRPQQSCKDCARIITGLSNTTHGDYGSKLNSIWHGSKDRCNNRNGKDWDNYGGRGITMFEEWNDSYECFRQWALINGYEEGLSLDRINSNKGYCPTNCRWIAQKDQQSNRRFNPCINGKNLLSEWCLEQKLDYVIVANEFTDFIQRRLSEDCV